MILRRLIYLCCLAGSLAFYLCYEPWISWIVLLWTLLIPWLSLLLSLPAMLQFRGELEAPDVLTMGERGQADLWGLSRLPQPRFRGRMVLRNLNSGTRQPYRTGTDLPTDHCGGLELSVRRMRVCDYLGLFSLPVRKVPSRTVMIRPVPIPMEDLPEPASDLAYAWRPKAGGGYSEHHELRPYRPGDPLNQIHWKLTAKTGDLMIREPMLPNHGLMVLTVDLPSTPKGRDVAFGRLLWVSRELLYRNLAHQIHCLTADGVQQFAIAGEQDLMEAIDCLLCHAPASSGTLSNTVTGAGWHFHIGGDSNEA